MMLAITAIPVIAFEQKKYKSCALLLFSLIDAKRICFQKRFHDNGQIQVGTGAIRYFERRYPNFADIPHIINRHFVAHGMTVKPVCKKDCIRLFYLYFNLLELFIST